MEDVVNGLLFGGLLVVINIVVGLINLVTRGEFWCADERNRGKQAAGFGCGLVSVILATFLSGGMWLCGLQGGDLEWKLRVSLFISVIGGLCAHLLVLHDRRNRDRQREQDEQRIRDGRTARRAARAARRARKPAREGGAGG